MRSEFSLQRGNLWKVSHCVILISLLCVAVLQVETRNVRKSIQSETNLLEEKRMLIEAPRKRLIRSADEGDGEEEDGDDESTSAKEDANNKAQSSPVESTTKPTSFITTTVNGTRECPPSCSECCSPAILKDAAPKPRAVHKGELYLPEDYNNFEVPKLESSRVGGKEGEKAPVVTEVFLKILGIREIDETNSVRTTAVLAVSLIEWNKDPYKVCLKLRPNRNNYLNYFLSRRKSCQQTM